MRNKTSWLTYSALTFANPVYASTCIFTKAASAHWFLSTQVRNNKKANFTEFSIYAHTASHFHSIS